MSVPLDKLLRVRDMLDMLDLPSDACLGASDRIATAVASLNEPEANAALTFCSAAGPQARQAIYASGAAIVLCRRDIEITPEFPDKTLIPVDNPRLAFIRVVTNTIARLPTETDGIAKSASVSRSARMAGGVAVGPMASIADDCDVGEGTRIDAGAVLYAGTRLGRRCSVQAGAVIGAQGFGFERDADGRPHRFPQLGRVVIGDDVEIGARACIDRGALGDTTIGCRTKIDDGAYIAHNVIVGTDCLIMAQAILCGSSTIGDRAEISPGAIVRNKVHIGAEARVGLGAVVTSDVAPGEVVAGVPARALSIPQQQA